MVVVLLFCQNTVSPLMIEFEQIGQDSAYLADLYASERGLNIVGKLVVQYWGSSIRHLEVP